MHMRQHDEERVLIDSGRHALSRDGYYFEIGRETSEPSQNIKIGRKVAELCDDLPAMTTLQSDGSGKFE
jgi:hypothetical protein